MTPEYRHGEIGLSEVVGFVLILGVLVLVISLYLTYGIPVQGRENEILHMNEVKDQFVAYKFNLDSLFNNNKVGTTVSNSFTLGTGGGYTQGMMSFIPVMSPISSQGVMAINQRTTDNETLNITSQSLVQNDTGSSDRIAPQTTLNSTPSHVYVNFIGITSTDLTSSRVFSAQVKETTSPQWTAVVNLTPQIATYQNYTAGSSCLASPYPTLVVGTTLFLCPQLVKDYLRSDITVTIIKNNVTTMQDYSVYRSVTANTNYSVDLMDDAYGVKSITPPGSTLTFALTNPGAPSGSTLDASANATYNFREMTPYFVSPIPLGALEYRAQNNYWITQDYYYQLGGVFLSQVDGNTTYKLPPEITFSYDNNSVNSKKIVTVNINALHFDQSSKGIVGGNSPVQVKTQLSSVASLPYANGTANTKWIRIGVNTSDSQSRIMWQNFFRNSAASAGIPNFTTGYSGTEAFIQIDGPDATLGRYDINVIATNATYSTMVQGIGGIVQ